VVGRRVWQCLQRSVIYVPSRRPTRYCNEESARPRPVALYFYASSMKPLRPNAPILDLTSPPRASHVVSSAQDQLVSDLESADLPLRAHRWRESSQTIVLQQTGQLQMLPPSTTCTVRHEPCQRNRLPCFRTAHDSAVAATEVQTRHTRHAFHHRSRSSARLVNELTTESGNQEQTVCHFNHQEEVMLRSVFVCVAWRKRLLIRCC
jgi:hypothetical protein